MIKFLAGVIVLLSCQGVSAETFAVQNANITFDNSNGELIIAMKIMQPDIRRFSDMTQRNIGRTVPIKVGDQTLSEVRIAEPIKNGFLSITYLESVLSAQKIVKSIINAGTIDVSPKD